MQQASEVKVTYAASKKGDSGWLALLNQIKQRGPGQVLVLGGGVGAFYGNQDLVPSVLGKDWTICVPPYAPTWEQLQTGLLQFESLINRDATQPRVGIFMAPPDFVSENMFRSSSTGPYPASIYWLGLPDKPLAYVEVLKSALSRAHIQSPWLQVIFSADDTHLRLSEQEELNNALLAQADLREILPRILRNLQDEMTALQAQRFSAAARSVAKKWWQFWR